MLIILAFFFHPKRLFVAIYFFLYILLSHAFLFLPKKCFFCVQRSIDCFLLLFYKSYTNWKLKIAESMHLSLTHSINLSMKGNKFGGGQAHPLMGKSFIQKHIRHFGDVVRIPLDCSQLFVFDIFFSFLFTLPLILLILSVSISLQTPCPICKFRRLVVDCCFGDILACYLHMCIYLYGVYL